MGLPRVERGPIEGLNTGAEEDDDDAEEEEEEEDTDALEWDAPECGGAGERPKTLPEGNEEDALVGSTRDDGNARAEGYGGALRSGDRTPPTPLLLPPPSDADCAVATAAIASSASEAREEGGARSRASEPPGVMEGPEGEEEEDASKSGSGTSDGSSD